VHRNVSGGHHGRSSGRAFWIAGMNGNAYKNHTSPETAVRSSSFSLSADGEICWRQIEQFTIGYSGSNGDTVGPNRAGTMVAAGVSPRWEWPRNPKPRRGDTIAAQPLCRPFGASLFCRIISRGLTPAATIVPALFG